MLSRLHKPVLIVLSLLMILTAGFFLFVFPGKQAYSSLNKQRNQLAEKAWANPVRILDSAGIINDLRFLSSDSCEGRKPGSVGHQRAMERIVQRFRSARLDSFSKLYLQEFASGRIIQLCNNVLGFIKGTKEPQKIIVLSAHYDHLGKTGSGEIYYGASDNASGVACLLYMADYFKKHPLPYSLLIAAFDCEESGIEGASYFIDNLPKEINLQDIKLNVNLDMIARETNNELFVSGLHHNPSLKYIIDKVQPMTNLKLLMGHDKGGRHEDWTHQSDHYAFHQKQIPFLYFGVEDHADYHKTTDTFDKINLSNYIEACNTIVQVMQAIKL